MAPSLSISRTTIGFTFRKPALGWIDAKRRNRLGNSYIGGIQNVLLRIEIIIFIDFQNTNHVDNFLLMGLLTLIRAVNHSWLELFNSF